MTNREPILGFRVTTSRQRQGSKGLDFLQTRGFSLVELLVVVGILAVLATMGMGLMSGFRGSSLTQSGNRVADAISQARQLALSKNVLTAVVVLPYEDATKPAMVAVAEYGPGPKINDLVAWKPVGGRVSLSEFVDLKSQNWLNVSDAPGDLGNIWGGGRSIGNNAQCMVFYPDGRRSGGADVSIEVALRQGGDNVPFQIEFHPGSAHFEIVY